ncbi:MAG: hypothetical protein ACYST6_15920 [Planctomycetota bacterium]
MTIGDARVKYGDIGSAEGPGLRGSSAKAKEEKQLGVPAVGVAA